MKFIKGNEKGTRIVKRLLAAVCTAALVLGLMPVNLGVTSVQAYDEIDKTTADCILSVDDQTTNITTNIDMYYEISTEPDDPYEGYVYVSDKNYTITFTANSGTFNENDITMSGTYGCTLTIVSKTLSADKKTYTFVVNFGANDCSCEISGSPTGTEAPTKTATTTTLSAASITVNYGETWTLTAQAKAGSTDVAGAAVVYYSDEDCNNKLDAAPTAVGTYYARGEYAGNDTYAASNSAAITVTIKEKTPEKGVDYDYTMAELLANGTTRLAAGTKIYLDEKIFVSGQSGGSYENGVYEERITDNGEKIKNYATYKDIGGYIKDTSAEVAAKTIITLGESYVFTYRSEEKTITGTEWYFWVNHVDDYGYCFKIMPTSPTEGYIEATVPTISNDGQPANASVKVGETAMFTVTATGDDLTYQWQIDRNDGKGFVDIDGATAASYTTSAVDAFCNGYKYHCVVTNSAGSVTTNDVTLTVTAEEPEVHKHTLVHHDTVAATTTTPGTKEYWQCSDCKKYFSDAEGKNEISAPESIPVVKPEDPTTPTEKDNVVRVGDDENSGKLTVESDIDTSAPATTVATKASDILSILEKDGTLTEAEIANIKAGNSDVEVILGVKDNKNNISTASKDLIKEKADAEGMTIAEYMDITLTKYIIPTGKTIAEATTTTQIKELTNGSIAITVTIPDAFKNTDASKTRTYYVLRNHNSEVTVLNGTLSSDGNEFTFTTDKFSDYVLTYKDTAKAVDDGGNNSGDNGNDESSDNGNNSSTDNDNSSTSNNSGKDANTVAATTATDTNATTDATASDTTASDTTTASSPKTGDSTPTAWLFVLLLGSAAGLFAVNGRKLGRKNQ